MTARRPTFLSRLAPAASTGAQAVRAALPARFSATDHLADQPAELDQCATGGSQAIERSSLANPREQPSGSSADRPALPQFASPQRFIDPHGASDQRPAVDPPWPRQAAEHAELLPSAKRDGDKPLSARAAIPATLVHHPSDVGVESQFDRDQTLLPKAAPVNAPGPLQPATVMERESTTRRPEPDVVELTIDRIDIRLPAEAGRSATGNGRDRRPGPTTPLSDYLRRGDPSSRNRA